MFSTLHRTPSTIRLGRRKSRTSTLSEQDAQRICHCPTILAANGRPVANPYYIGPDVPPSEDVNSDSEPELEVVPVERPLSRYNRTSKEYQLTGRRGSVASSHCTEDKSSSTESFIPIVVPGGEVEVEEDSSSTTMPSSRRSSLVSCGKSIRFSDTIIEKEFETDPAAFQTIPGPSKIPKVLRKVWRAVY